MSDTKQKMPDTTQQPAPGAPNTITTLRKRLLLFLLAPLSSYSVYIFAAGMGLLWLSTVPLTNGVIASIFGLKYLSMLSGFVFFSHQVGSFMGVWLGGYIYTLMGNYNFVWGITLALGIFAALINLPVNENPVSRQEATA